METLESLELFRVGATARSCLRVIPSQTARKNQKVVVGDASGQVVCFKMEGKKPKVVWQRMKSKEIACVVLGGCSFTENNVYIAHGQTVEGLKKKGVSCLSFNTSLNEDLSSIFVQDNRVWTAGDHIFNCFENQKDASFYMSTDHINSFVIANVCPEPGVPPTQYAVLGCRDKFIRVLHGSDLFFEQDVGSPVTVVQEFAMDSGRPKTSTTIVYGTMDGRLGVLELSDKGLTSRFVVAAANESGAVNAIKVGQVTGDALPEVVVGRDNGVLDVYELQPNSGPILIGSEKVSESITAVDIGFVTGLCDCDIVVSTFSGRIIAFHFDRDKYVPNSSAKFGAAGYSYTADRAQMDEQQIQSCKKQIQSLEYDVEELRRTLSQKRSKYQMQSQELVAVKEQFKMKHSFNLLEKEACYELVVETDNPMAWIVFRSNVDLPIAAGGSGEDGILTKSPTADGSFVAAVRMLDAKTRYSIKLRMMEGKPGSITAMAVSDGYPKACRTCFIELRPLCMHSKVPPNSFPGGLPRRASSGSTSEEIGGPAMSTLEMCGEFTLKQLNSWLLQAIPGVPPRVTTDEIHLTWKNVFAKTHLVATYRKGEANFRSNDLSTLGILKESLSQTAAMNKVGLRVSMQINPKTGPEFVDLVRPIFDYHGEVTRKHARICVLEEIRLAEGTAESLAEEYRELLNEAETIRAEFEKSKLLDLGTLVRNIIDTASKITGRRPKDSPRADETDPRKLFKRLESFLLLS